MLTLRSLKLFLDEALDEGLDWGVGEYAFALLAMLGAQTFGL
jgi:hypothetical protein